MPTVITIRKVDGKPGSVYYPLRKIDLPEPNPQGRDVVVTMSAAALNHRDLFIRQHLYPGVSFDTPQLADGCGIVTATGSDPAAKKWLGRRVVLNPGTGWKNDLEGPEGGAYNIVGGTKVNPAGTLAESMVFDAGECEDAPEHLSDVEAAALPLTGLTAWRATVVKSGNAKPGRNVLVTGIGGGVAIMALLFLAHTGANVFVTSGDEVKLAKAKELGAKGGVNYKDKDWDKKLLKLLPNDRPYLDAVVDGAGGDIVAKTVRILKHGGIISSYGMTIAPKLEYLMSAVIKNIEIRGSTMGSRKEFADMIKFVNEKGLKPVVSRVAQGLDLDNIDSLYDDMKQGKQFGKLVVDIRNGKQISSKL